MGLLSAIGAGVGLLSGIQQNKRAQALEDQARRDQRRALQRLELYQQRVESTVHDLEANGWGDPNAGAATMRAMDARREHQATLASKRAAMAARMMGQRPGDTAGQQMVYRAATAGDTEYNLLSQQYADGMAEQARQAKLSALSLYNPSAVVNAQYGDANSRMIDAQGQYVDLAPAASGLLNGLGSMTSRKPKTNPTTPTPPATTVGVATSPAGLGATAHDLWSGLNLKSSPVYDWTKPYDPFAGYRNRRGG